MGIKKSQENIIEKTGKGEGSGGRQRAGESACTAPSGICACIGAVIVFRTERVYQVQ
jgi:hypothetical protein